MVKATQNSVKAGTKIYNIGKNGAIQASNYIGGRIRMGQLNAGHQWIVNSNTSNSGFLSNSYKPSSPANTPIRATNLSNPANSNFVARMNPLNNFSSNTVKPAPITNPQPPTAGTRNPGNGSPSSGKQGAVWDKVKNSAWGKQTSQTGERIS